jgi:threonine aldolase
MSFIELRSDTFTQPTPEMLEAMMAAPVGDDVFGEDPTMNRLEQRCAELFGVEAGLFCPSGTMTNQIAIKVHTQPGDEVICDFLSHVYQYEGGGIAFNAGCSVRLLEGNRGRISTGQVAEAINPDDVHKPRTSLVVLENTSNRGGGACYDFTEMERISSFCRQSKLGFHLDGARLWNAMVAKQEDPKEYGRIFDSISVCLSKGMGAPVGSVLLGSKDFIRQARRVRKVFGGGMRQAGYLASACIYALDHHVARLEEDHRHTRTVAEAIRQKDWCAGLMEPETNILIFHTAPTMPAKAMVAQLDAIGIRCLATGSHAIRMVFHLGVSSAQVDDICTRISAL